MTEPPLALAQAMLECIAVPPDLVAPRMERVAGVMYASLSSYVQGRVALSREAFLQDLIDALVALIDTPPSANTLRAIADEEEIAS